MATDDSQFVATGGDSATEDGPNFGFYTDPSQDDDDGAQLNYGVNVQGNVCGIYAESLMTPQTLGERQTPVSGGERVGVYAIGQDHGVMGKAIWGNGVEGTSSYDSGVGVQGSHDNNRVGVLGFGYHGYENPKKEVERENGISIGVLGASNDGKGIGVRGVSVKTFHPDNPLPDVLVKEEDIDGQGIGVKGESDSGVGIQGHSNSGPGVKGESEKNRGGIFKSTSIAQIQLTPAPLLDPKTPSPLPAHGMAGDLFVRLIPDGKVQTPQGDVTRIQAELWFCIEPTEKSPGDPVIWKQVLLA